MTKKRSAVALLVSLCFGGVGCVQAKPDLTASMSLNGRLRYTTETFLGYGAVSNDATNLYVSLASRPEARSVVAEGEYLQIKAITQDAGGDVVVCIPKGLIVAFHDRVTIGETGTTVLHRLVRTC